MTVLESEIGALKMSAKAEKKCFFRGQVAQQQSHSVTSVISLSGLMKSYDRGPRLLTDSSCSTLRSTFTSASQQKLVQEFSSAKRKPSSPKLRQRIPGEQQGRRNGLYQGYWLTGKKYKAQRTCSPSRLKTHCIKPII